MSLYMPAGSMPYWSYWVWGFIGIIALWWGWSIILYKDNDGHTHIDIEGIFLMFVGLFLTFYWLNKIGIIPMRHWELHNWFYKFH